MIRVENAKREPAEKVSKAKLNTSAKAVERSSEKICYTKHKSESRISRLLLLLSAQKKIGIHN